jgi:hypothetical protein
MKRTFEVIDSQTPKHPPRWRILIVGEHRSLLRTSADVLRNADAEVVCSHPTDLHAHSGEPFHLLVLCHSLARQEAVSIAAEARQRWPKIRVLAISRFNFGLVPIPSHADGVASCGNILELFTRATELLGDTPQQGTTPDHQSTDAAASLNAPRIA